MPKPKLTRAAGKAGKPAGPAWGICPALYAIAGALTLSPLLWARVPALVDYPNHLARAWILVHAAEIPALAGNYSVHWRILPDLAMDGVVSALAYLVPVELAGRIFVALTMAALVGGTIALHRVLHGRVGLWPLCSMLFVYNAVLFWGFVSCLFAIGVCLLVLSGWIATRHWRIGVRLALFSLAASLLLLLHLFAFGLYGLSMAAYELRAGLGRNRPSLRSLIGWIATWLQLVPGLALWRASLAHAGSTLTAYGGVAPKLYALVAPFDFGVAPAPLDWLVAIVACLGLVLAIVTRTIRLAPEMRLPLAAMAVGALLMPNRMSGAWGADLRLPAALPFIVIASTSLEISRRSAAGIALGIGAALLVLRVWSVSQSWRDYDRWFTEFRTAAATLPPGSRLLVAAVPPSMANRRLPGLPAFLARLEPAAFTHMAALAVIDRAVFFPYLFTGWTTIDVTARNLPMSQKEGQPATLKELAQSEDGSAAFRANAIGELPYWRNWRQDFDFALVIDFGRPPQPVPRSLHPVRRGSFFELYRIAGAQHPAPFRQYDAAAKSLPPGNAARLPQPAW